MIYLFVGLGGVLGALCRYLVSTLVQPFASSSMFPAATLLCNYAGSLALGWLSGGGALKLRLRDKGRTALTSGFVGSFTTFSAFSMDMVQLIERGEGAKALIYLLLSLWGGLALAWAGGRIAEKGRSPKGGEA